MDPRIIKTKRDIRQALLELLEEKPYEKITIKMVSERALVARPTFYAHYDSVQDILINYLEDLYHKNLMDSSKIRHLSVENLTEFYGWMRELKGIISLLYKNNLEAIIYKLNKRYIDECSFLMPDGGERLENDVAYLRYVQLAGGLVYAQVLSMVEQDWNVSDQVAAETTYKSCNLIFRELLKDREFLA